ncbi:MAG TPA: pitrilysin family protein [Longimicrobiaceae bacterium]|nr:pitrilysin family protein [Longimicrobiaceae bacterium]
MTSLLQLPRPSACAVGLLVAALAACAPAPPEAAVAPAPEVNRAVQPVPGPTPDVDLPDVQRRTLSNGLDVWVVQRRDVPLVTLRMITNAGSAAEPAQRSGLASLTAAMLDEGTATRSALQIADEVDFLGASLGTGAGYDAAFATLSTLKRTLPAALEVYADVITNPAFPERELERVRRERITSLIEALDRPSAVASEQAALRIYGPQHPYGRPPEGTVASLGGLRGDDLRQFYRSYYRPNNSTLLVVGDVSADEITPMLEQAFRGWQRAEVPAIRYPAPPAPQAATRVYLIDKPDAAQSEIVIGHLGVARKNPDYFPLLVLNTILGGQFSSRINMNLREEKGYTYGARTAFSMRRQPGPFLASAAVQTATSKESVIEFMKELEEIRGRRPVTREELESAKAGLVRREPLDVETQAQLASRLEAMVLYDLPEDYFDTYTEQIEAVTLADVERVAREHLHPERFAVVIVGDRSRIEAGLRELPYPLEVVPLERRVAPGTN